MTDTLRRVAIVGASAAGLAVATGLRDEGFEGEILLLGAEESLPYDRPPLSKRFFATEHDRSAIALTSRDELASLSIDFRGGNPAVALDPKARSLRMRDGTQIDWQACVVATGATPIALPGHGLVLRTFEDAIRIDRALQSATKVIVIGAGVLGCELAALARARDAVVEVVDIQKGPMLDRLGPEISARLEALHRDHQVAFRFGLGIERIEGNPEIGFRLTFADSTVQEADLVLVAVGCRPAIQWLADSGLKLDDGVCCDAYCRAAPGVFAAGDVANWMNLRYERRMRIEHRMNATEQGLAVAANIMGAERPYDPIPFFWTDQYDARIQVYGAIGGAMQTDILARTEAGGFLVAYSQRGKVEGVLGWNMAKALRAARGLLGAERGTALADFAEAARS